MSEIDDSKILATMGGMLLQCDDEDADLAAFACIGAAAEPLDTPRIPGKVRRSTLIRKLRENRI